MKTINDVLNNHTIRLYLPSEVLSLPTLNEDVEVNYYPANDLICIRLKNKSSYSEKLIPCNDTDTLIKELRKLAPKKTKANSKNTKAKNENTNAQSGNDDNGENKTCDYSDTPSKSALEAVENNNSETLEATNVGTFTIDPETGEVLELSRDYEGLRRSWKLQCEYAKSSACWRLTRFCTCTIDTKPTYSELNTIVAAFCKWLTRNYTDLLDNCFIFLEPCDDGSWHVHFLIAMIDKPLTFDDEVKIKEWWARKNTKPCDDQVQFAEPFESVDDLLRVLDYLNPTSKKKRHRIKNYPQSCQPMRHIGNVVEPNKALTKFEIAKTILREEKTERRNAIEIEQTNTGVLLYSCKEYLFVAAQNLLKATQAEVVNDNTHETPSGEKEVISDNGKTDWFACKHNDGKCKCDKCDRQKTCDKRNRCEEHCIGFDTSFCRGCIWND